VDEESEEDKPESLFTTTPKKCAWGNISRAPEAVPDLTTIFAEESEKAKQEKTKAQAKEVYKPPKPSGMTPSQSYESSEPRVRERLPIPTEPPFTAFVGNLSYEVTNEILMNYFYELGVHSIRVKTDVDKPKGFAYIEFTTQEGLINALKADKHNFYGRQLHMDVAKPPTRSYSIDKVRYVNTGDSSGTSKFSRPLDRVPSERPKLNIYPPSSKTPPSQLHETISKPKGSYENPFGSAVIDYKKMDLLSQERLKKELEIERREKEKKEEHSKHVYKPVVNSETKTASSWRAPLREHKVIKDEEGFISRVHHPTTSPEKPSSLNFPPSPRINVDKSNIYASLSEQND